MENIAKDLIYKNGIYYSKKNNCISYPEDGNLTSLQIEEKSFWFKHRNDCIKSLVSHYHSDNDIFYDVGGGNGFVSRAIEQLGINTILVEPGIEGAVNAKNRGLKNIICSSLEHAMFEDSSLPAIGLFDVVEHIQDDRSFLRKINNVLCENGKVYISVPSYQFLWSKDDDDSHHYRRYTLKSLNKLLSACNFSIIYETYIFSILPLPIFLFRSLPSKFGKVKNATNVSKQTKEHTIQNSIVDRFTNYIWNKELIRINNLKSIPFGGSCLILQKKINN